MGMLFDWWLKRHMKDPVLGVLRTTGWYIDKIGRGGTYTAVVTAPGIPATTVTCHAYTDSRLERSEGRSLFGDIEYPVLVDRTDPSQSFVILWKQMPPRLSDRERALLTAQQEAERLNATQGEPSAGAPGAQMPQRRRARNQRLAESLITDEASDGDTGFNPSHVTPARRLRIAWWRLRGRRD
jgi:hypothetical protein